MEMIPVQSKQIVEAGYEPDTKVLRVRFLHGNSVYEYQNVPQDVYDALMAAPSIGSYHAANIKNAFPYSRVS